MGDLDIPEENPPCTDVQLPLTLGDKRVLRCEKRGKYLSILMPHGALALSNVEPMGVVAPLGSWRISTGRQCCHGTCNHAIFLFDGYDPDCETRCRSNPRCRFFTV